MPYKDAIGPGAKFGYEVKYMELNPMDILNLLEPAESEIERKWRFYKPLEESIKAEGVRNPIMVNAGHVEEYAKSRIPRELRKDISNLLICCRYGGSRLYFAQKLGLEKIPCLVSDFVNRYRDIDSIFKVSSLEAYYTPPIKEVIFTENGLWGKT